MKRRRRRRRWPSLNHGNGDDDDDNNYYDADDDNDQHTHLNKVTIAFTFASRIRTLNPNIVIIMMIAAGKYKSSIVRGCVCRA